MTKGNAALPPKKERTSLEAKIDVAAHKVLAHLPIGIDHAVSVGMA
jgi:hypothetical protein